MANIKISDLTAAAAASGTQEFEVNDSLTSKKVTGAQLLAYTKANTTPADIGALATTAGAVGATNLASNSVTTAKIADNNVTLAKLPDIATASILGRTTAGTGDPEVLTGAQARSVIGADNASNLTSGTVGTARLGTGTANSTTFLRGDQTWATAGGAPANFGDIGTVLVAGLDITSNTLPNNTIAGSNCYYPSALVGLQSNGNWVTNGNTDGAPPGTIMRNADGPYFFIIGRGTTGNTGYQSPLGCSTLSGTWRILTAVRARTTSYDSYAVTTSSNTYCALIQRIS